MKYIQSIDTDVDTACDQDKKRKMLIERERDSGFRHKYSPVMLSKQDKCSFVQ